MKSPGAPSLVECPYCGKRADLVPGSSIYPHRQDLVDKKFYLCSDCSSWVGCHPGTIKPLGTLADAETRSARSRAHSCFDPLWKQGKMSRKEAYAWLANELQIANHDCHISWFEADTCNKVINICTRHIDQAKQCVHGG